VANASHVGLVVDAVDFPVEEGKVREFAIVVGGVRWEHHTPVEVGDRLRGERVVKAVTTKERPNGVMTLITLELALHRASDGALAVTQTDTVIELP
jgi:acyl dehydratase